MARKRSLELYTVRDFAEMTGLHIVTVRNYIKRGELRASKIGRKYIITSDSFKDFIKANTIETKEAKHG